MSTFGIIVPGRPVDTNFQQVEHNKFLITIPNADTLNHVVVFLSGAVQVPQGTACCIYFSMPDPNAPPLWCYLGYLSSEKPSAIYKLSNLTSGRHRDGQPDLNSNSALAFNYMQAPVSHVAQIGISIEPTSAAVDMVPATETVASNVNSFTQFMNKTVSNLYNYCSSFSRSASDLMGNPFQSNPPASNIQYVPLSSIQTWYENYSRRLGADQNFWKSLN